MISTAYDEAIRVCANLLISSASALLIYVAICALTATRNLLPESVQRSWLGALLNRIHAFLITTY